MSDTALEFMVGSAARPDTLTALRNHGRLSVRALDERLSISRRTLKRTLGSMESRGWVRVVDSQYELTSLGVAMLAAYERCRERERLAEQFRPFLEQTPASEFDLGLDSLADATLTRSDGDPTATTDRLVALRTDAARIRECAPFLLRDTVQQLAKRVTNEQSPPNITLIIGDGMPTPEGYSPEYCEWFDTLTAAPSVDIYVHPDDVQLPFGIIDGYAVVGAIDPSGMPSALVESEGAAIVEWAERRFEEKRAEAEPLT